MMPRQIHSLTRNSLVRCATALIGLSLVASAAQAARIENRVFVAIVVVMFAGIPFIDVDLNTIRYDSSRSAQCQVSVPQPTDTGWSQSFSTINNQYINTAAIFDAI